MQWWLGRKNLQDDQYVCLRSCFRLDSSNSSISSFITNRIAANAQTGRNWNDVKPPWFCSSPVMTASNSPLRRKNWPQILKPAEMILASPSSLPRETQRDRRRERRRVEGLRMLGFWDLRYWRRAEPKP